MGKEEKEEKVLGTWDLCTIYGTFLSFSLVLFIDTLFQFFTFQPFSFSVRFIEKFVFFVFRLSLSLSMEVLLSLLNLAFLHFRCDSFSLGLGKKLTSLI